MALEVLILPPRRTILLCAVCTALSSPARAQQGGPGEPPPIPQDEIDKLMARRLANPDPELRMAAVRSCGRDKIAACLPGLIDMLGPDEETPLRGAAALALGRIGDEAAAPALSAAHWRDDDPVVRQLARESLQLLGYGVRPGPYWEWEEYRELKSKQSFGIGVLALGCGGGLIVTLIGFFTGIVCSNDCGDSWDAAVAGLVVAGAGGLLGGTILVTTGSAMNELKPAYPEITTSPRPPVTVGRKGGRFALRWRF